MYPLTAPGAPWSLQQPQQAKQAIEEELKAVNLEFDAINAYEATKSGKSVSTSTGSQRAPRGARKKSVLSLLKNNPNGIGRGDILAELHAKGDKSAEASISNTLAGLKRAGDISLDDGKYTIAG